ncbi:MAG: cytochrome c [Burkholderiaceae bacterium]
MRTRSLSLLLALVAASAAAQTSAPFAGGDPKKGAAMTAKDCNGCHLRRFGDVPSAYTRIDRRVNTPAQLKAQIAYCNSQLGTGYFPDEEEHIAAYLDLEYYKFKP